MFKSAKLNVKLEKKEKAFYSKHPKLMPNVPRIIKKVKGSAAFKKRKLFLKAERLWKEIAYQRDGRQCQVRLHFPEIRITHSDIYQVDHCITRNDKNLFFDPRNATVICSSCNAAKGFKNKGIDYAVQQIVMRRESPEAFGMMMEIHQTMGPNTNWGQVWWLEKVVADLEDYKKNLGARNEESY